MNVTCQQFVTLLYDFVEGELVAETRESVEIHIQGCPSCGVYMESYRYTKQVARSLPRCRPLSAEFTAKLERMLEEQLRGRTGDQEPL